MSKVIVTESYLEDIGDAIRAKLGGTDTYKPSEMAAAIGQIHGEATLEPLSVTENGTYTPSTGVDGFSQVDVEVQGGGSGSTTYVGTTDPLSTQGKKGDFYIKYVDTREPYDETATRTYTINITKGLRGSSELTYVGAQEIQLFFDDGNGNEVNIRTLANFTYSCNRGSSGLSYAFDGNTSGNYWEATPTPVIVTISATVPAGYKVSKFVVWQRTGSYNTDVWADFELDEIIDGVNIELLKESNLTVNDWAGAGYGTEWEINGKIVVVATYAKIGETSATAEWVETPIDVTIGGTLIAKNITENGTYDPTDDNADGYSSVVVNVTGGGGIIPDVPSEYQKVEYIIIGENYVNQYITIPSVSANTQIKAKFRPTSYGDKPIIGGHRNGEGNTNYDFELNVNSKGESARVWARSTSNFTYDNLEMESYTLTVGSSVSNNEFNFNAELTVLGSYPSSSETNLRIFIGTYYPNGNYRFNGICYYVSLKNKTSGDYDYFFVPCYRKSDGKVGFYDTVNDVFYPNEGTGEFGKGADVNE